MFKRNFAVRFLFSRFDLEKRSGIIFGGPFDYRAEFVETREKRFSRSEIRFFRAFRTSKSVLASYSAVLLIPAAEFAENAPKKRMSDREIRFVARSGPRKAL